MNVDPTQEYLSSLVAELRKQPTETGCMNRTGFLFDGYLTGGIRQPHPYLRWLSNPLPCNVPSQSTRLPLI